MDVSLDTDITIHLFTAGREDLLYQYFDKLYMHTFILEKEIKNKSIDVYQRIYEEKDAGKIIIVDQAYLIDIGMKISFENNLFDYKTLFDYGEANAVALAATMGIAALVTDDTKEHGPHDTLLKELIQDVIPFSFYELLFLEFLKEKGTYDRLKRDFGSINSIAYPKHPMEFVGRISRVVRRFNSKGTKRDIEWIKNYCKDNNIDYKQKVLELKNNLQ